MNLANLLTISRIVLAPIFLALFATLQVWPGQVWLLGLLWGIFLVGELSDVLDGWIARRFNQQSDLGKLLDPFADVISRLTYFLCLLTVGITPLYAFAIIMYREIAVTFLRLLLVQRGKVQAASMGGKVKAWLYFLASLSGFGLYTWKVLDPPTAILSNVWFTALSLTVEVAFALSVILSVLSFLQYFAGFLKISRSK